MSIIIIIAANSGDKPNPDSAENSSLIHSVQNTRQMDTAGLLQALKMRKHLLIDMRPGIDSSAPDAMANAVLYEHAGKEELLLRIKASVITIAYGSAGKISEVKAMAEALERESSNPVYYYSEGIETWNSLADFFKKQ